MIYEGGFYIIEGVGGGGFIIKKTAMQRFGGAGGLCVAWVLHDQGLQLRLGCC